MVSFSKLLPACGFAIAAALAGVTSAFKEAPKDKSGQTMYTFEYTPPASDPTHPYSVGNVENVANWTFTSNDDRCLDVNIRACKIFASPDNVDASGDEPVLLSTEDISAAIFPTTGTAYVQSTDDGALGTATASNISNKSN